MPKVFTQKVAHFHACHTGTTNSVRQHKLRKLIAWLSVKEGRGKEFISLYIPPEEPLDGIVAILKKELDTIRLKSESKDRPQEALKIAIQHVKQLGKIPENGLAMFAGILVGDSPQGEIAEIREILPPYPIVKFLFEINNHFDLEPLREMLREQKIVGLIALDSKEAGFGVLDGERLEILENITSGIPGKSGKGGQSQRRYERERDMELTYFFHRIAEHAAKTFLESCKITVLIVGGPGPTKNDFVNGGYLHYELRNAILSTVDTQFAGIEGVKEALSKSSEELKGLCAPEEKIILQRLFAELSKKDGLAIYGLELIFDALQKGEVETVLVNDNTDVVENAAICMRCGQQKRIMAEKRDLQAIKKFSTVPCARCGATEYEVEEKDIVDVLEDAASRTDAKVEVISTESEEKTKLKSLGGFGAILRYRPA